MSEDAIQTAQVENWLVDYYSNQPTVGLDKELGQLHFDNLKTTDEVRNYWGHLTVNTRNAVAAAAKAKNPMRIVQLTGMSLHAVQDFYTHSNWVEVQRPAVNLANYSTRTWFDATPGRLVTTLRTGTYPPANPASIQPTEHGNYDLGMNHDSYVRPRFDEAYVYGYCGSRQWVAAIKSWVDAVDPRVWPTVQTLALSSTNRTTLQKDLQAAYRISEWIAASGNDGHWKGKGSGSGADFVKFAAVWASGGDSIFVDSIKKDNVHRDLTAGLTTSALVVAPPAVPASPRFNKQAVRVKTMEVEEQLSRKSVNGSSKPNYFAKITIGGQEFIETMQSKRDSIRAFRDIPVWYTIKFINAADASTNIHYELFSENGKDDTMCDINPKAMKQSLDFALTGRAVGGDAGNADRGSLLNFIGAAPDKFPARVRIAFDSLPLEP